MSSAGAARRSSPTEEPRARTAQRPDADRASRNGAGGLFDPRPRGPARAVVRRVGDRRAPIVLGEVGVIGFIALSLVMIGLGVLLTHVLDHGIVHDWDVSTSRWFARQRTASLNTWSSAATWLAETPTIIGVGLIALGLLARARAWRSAAFLLTSLLLEVTVFIATVYTIDRPRPAVKQLEDRFTGSYPSGHVAASIALYGALAIIASTSIRSRRGLVLLWVPAVAVPVVVVVARLYRGMHYVTDVGAGVLLGLGCLLVAGFAVRCASAAAERGRGHAAPPGRPAWASTGV